jgi:DNA-binding SARP family transcriptional activator/DNA-binding XRE family transcriptional regulator
MENGDLGPELRFGALVQAYRREAGMTQRELAAKAGLSVAALRDIEQLRRHWPRPRTLAALCHALGLDSERAAILAGAGRRQALHPAAPGSSSWPATETDRPGQGLWLAALGPLEAWRDGRPLSIGPPARRAVLGLLLMYPGTPVRRDAIIDVLWGQRPPRTAPSLVQAHVSRLRQVLEPPGYPADHDGVFHSARGAYRLNLSDGEVDFLAFKDLAARADAAWAAGDDVTACGLYERAVELHRGDPFADVDILAGNFGTTLLRTQVVDVLLRYAQAAFALGLYRRVLPRLQALAVADPLNESVHASLMIALAGSGQQAAAIRTYEDLRSRLDRELGLYPGEELTEAHVRVLRQDIRRGTKEAPEPPAKHVPKVVHRMPRQPPATPRYLAGTAGYRECWSATYSYSGGEVHGHGHGCG